MKIIFGQNLLILSSVLFGLLHICQSHFVEWSYGNVIPPPPRLPKKLTDLEIMVDITNDLSYKVLHFHSISNRNNFAFSPTALGSVLIALYEGCDGRGLTEIYHALQLPYSRDVIRIGYRDIHRRLRTYFFDQENPLIGLSLNKENVTITPEYESILKFYGYDLGVDMISSGENKEDMNQTSTMESMTNTTMVPDKMITVMSIKDNETTTTTTITTENVSTTTKESETTEMPTESPTTTTSSTNPTVETTTISSTEKNEMSTSTLATTNQPSTTTVDTSTLLTTTSDITTTENAETTTITTTELTSTTDSTTTTDMLPSTTLNPGTAAKLITIDPSNVIFPAKRPVRTAPAQPSSLPSLSTTSEDQEPKRVRRHFPLSLLDSGYFTISIDTTHTQPIQPAPIQPPPVIQPYAREYELVEIDDAYFKSKDLSTRKHEIHHVFYLNPQQTVQTTYKVYNSILNYAHIDAVRSSVLELDLDSNDYTLLLMIPDYDFGLDALLSSLKLAPTLRVLRKTMKPRWVQAIIPDFKLKGDIFITNDLQNMGIMEIFEPSRADFTRMTEENDIYVKHIEQSININIRTRPIDQLKRNIGAYAKPIDVSVNHPFLFFIIDKELDVATIAGRVINPLNVRIQ